MLACRPGRASEGIGGLQGEAGGYRRKVVVGYRKVEVGVVLGGATSEGGYIWYMGYISEAGSADRSLPSTQQPETVGYEAYRCRRAEGCDNSYCKSGVELVVGRR